MYRTLSPSPGTFVDTSSKGEILCNIPFSSSPPVKLFSCQPEALVLANLSTMQKLKNLRHASSGVHRGTMAPTMGAVVPQDMHMPKMMGLSTAALHKGGCSHCFLHHQLL
jgi:hypothetical protein